MKRIISVILICMLVHTVSAPAYAWGSKKYKKRISELEKELTAQQGVCAPTLTDSESRKIQGLQKRVQQLEQKQAANQEIINAAYRKDQEMAKLKQEIKRLKKQLDALQKK